MNVSSKQKKELIIELIVVGIVLVIGGVYIYNQGADKTTIAPLPFDTDGSGNTTNVTTDTATISSIATQIYNDCNGVDWFTDHDETIYANALSLNDTNFTALYNTFNTKYQTQTGYTLTGIINASWATPLTEWSATKAAMITRLGKLNLP